MITVLRLATLVGVAVLPGCGVEHSEPRADDEPPDGIDVTEAGTVPWDDRVDFEPWHPPGRPKGGWPTEPPSRWVGLQAHLLLPHAVQPGRTVDYVVVLRNISDDAIDLRPCGGYRQEVRDVGAGMASEAVDGGASEFRLSCDAAPVLSPAETYRYAMRLTVPAAATGDDLLFIWGFVDDMPDYYAQEWVRLSPP